MLLLKLEDNYSCPLCMASYEILPINTIKTEQGEIDLGATEVLRKHSDFLDSAKNCASKDVILKSVLADYLVSYDNT